MSTESPEKTPLRKKIRIFTAYLFAIAFIVGAIYLQAVRVPVVEPKRKVVVLGFDGADPRLCRDYMEKGLLPNLAKLANEGTFSELGTTIPSMSPVSWSSFAVGGNPGYHGVFDFLTRTPEGSTYIPSPESFVGKEEPYFWHGIPVKPPKVINKRGGIAFWDVASQFGIKTALVLVPCTFAPPELPNGLAISGLGVPDLCGTQATYFYLTDDPEVLSEFDRTEFGGAVTELALGKDGVLEGKLVGPISPVWKQELAGKQERLEELKKNLTDKSSREEYKKLQKEIDSPDRLTMPIRVKKSEDGQSAEIRIDRESHTAKVGEWSEWYRVSFEVTRFISAHGICKVRLDSVSPYVRLYVSPIEISPEKPPLSICHPANVTANLVEKIGLFKTRGWAADSAALKEGFLNEEAFMQDIFEIMEKRKEMALEVLEQDDWGLYVAVFSSTDRVSHMMWRLIDPKHPMYDKELAKRFGDSIQKTYEKMDEIVGAIRAKIDESNTDLYVISDHGFRSFRKAVNLNTWLSTHGPGGNAGNPFMELRGKVTRKYNLDDLFSGKSDFFQTEVYDPIEEVTKSEEYVEWKKTQAFALGLATVYINLKERESKGYVSKADYQAVCEEIARGLESYRDPKTGEKVVRRVYQGTETYSGPYADPDKVTFPDLMVGFEEGYRVGWQSTLGGISPEVISDNLEKWSGDHCGIDPSLTPGILYSNRTVTDTTAAIIDMAPTILEALGVPFESPEGRALQLTEENGSQ
ncbi:MAG: alkaline phosphatase family protein [Candidatus Omnitrophica bacterium]|nr:alkaline phosphatase family protein [Candidatus Omnitrophota bacterium]